MKRNRLLWYVPLLLSSLAVLPTPVLAQKGTAVQAPVRRVPAGMFLTAGAGVAVTAPGEATRSVRSLDQFYVGDRVSLAATATKPAVIVFYGTGERLSLAPGSAAKIVQANRLQMQVGMAPKRLTPMRTDLLKSFVLEPDQKRFGPRPGGLTVRAFYRQSSGPLHCLGPLGSFRNTTEPVILRWDGADAANPSANGVTVLVWDMDLPDGVNGKPMLTQTMAPGVRECTVPADLLHPGGKYKWRVVTDPADPTAFNPKDQELEFRVLTPAELHGVTATEGRMRALVSAASEDSEAAGPLLLLACYYEQRGLFDEALNTYTDASHKLPDDTLAKDRIQELERSLGVSGKETTDNGAAEPDTP